MSNARQNTYCVKCREKTQWLNAPKLYVTANQRSVMRGKCFRCETLKCTFVPSSSASVRARSLPSTSSAKIPKKTNKSNVRKASKRK